MKLFSFLLDLSLKLLVAIGVAAWWVTCLLTYGVKYAMAWRQARKAAAQEIRCQNGHVLEDVGTWTCATCGWTWTGHGWWCPNESCPKPATSFLDCQECGHSIKNPFRF